MTMVGEIFGSGSGVIEFFNSMEIVIPFSQIALLLLLSTAALLWGRKRLALLINYIFTLYWGYLSHQMLLERQGQIEISFFNTFCYFGFGIAVVVLTLIGFFSHSE